MKNYYLVATIALRVSALICGPAQAQVNNPSDDSILVKNVKIWYPGGSMAGKIKAELWWHQPEYPYSLPTRGVALHRYWGDIGTIVCDSIRGLQVSSSYTIEYAFTIDNSLGRVDAEIDLLDDSAYFDSGHYHLADMYFTVNSSGRFVTNGANVQFFCLPPLACMWWGRHIPSVNIIADPGDFNGDGITNISDCVYGIRYIFESFADPLPCGDANGDCITNISDVVYLLNYLFSGGPQPSPGCEFWR